MKHDRVTPKEFFWIVVLFPLYWTVMLILLAVVCLPFVFGYLLVQLGFHEVTAIFDWVNSLFKDW